RIKTARTGDGGSSGIRSRRSKTGATPRAGGEQIQKRLLALQTPIRRQDFLSGLGIRKKRQLHAAGKHREIIDEDRFVGWVRKGNQTADGGGGFAACFGCEKAC